jgi:hypothetical protein
VAEAKVWAEEKNAKARNALIKRENAQEKIDLVSNLVENLKQIKQTKQMKMMIRNLLSDSN